MHSIFVFRTLLIILPIATLPLARGADDIAQVRTVAPIAATQAQAYEVPGRTEPLESATIFTRATGIIRERMFDIGDPVKAGDVLAVIDAPDIDKAVDAARAAVEEASAKAKIAGRISKRSNNLAEINAVSREIAEQRSADGDGANAALRAAQATLARLEEQQRFATVRAPFDGVIAARNFDRGDRVRGDSSTAEGWLYRMVRLETLRFVINATPDLTFRLTPESGATIHFNELPGRSFQAKVARSSRTFDTASGTMRVELLLENKQGELPAGLTGTAHFSLPASKGTYLLPANAIVLRSGKPNIATVADGKVKFLEVTTGRNFGTQLEAQSADLTTDLKVILNPNAMLSEGHAVREAPAAPPAK